VKPPNDGPDDHGMRGGQFWRQPKFPFHSRYVVYLCGDDADEWVVIGDPRQQGNVACQSEMADGSYRDRWTGADLRAHLERVGYEYVGQFADVVASDFADRMRGSLRPGPSGG
jgi:hypothetical protein